MPVAKKVFSPKTVYLLSLVFVIQVSCGTPQHQEQTSPSTALQRYLHNGDTLFHLAYKKSFDVGKVKGYDLLLISQRWQQYTWKHQLTILAPSKNRYDGALLFIAYGLNNKKTRMPEWEKPGNDLMQEMSKIAEKNNAIVAIVRQVPNEPLFGGLKENSLVAYTLKQFQEHPTDYTWPLLFPMVKSAIKAMDAVQKFSKKKLHHTISRFVISGTSKRGWTTWLTAASDPRVAAIGPMVFDMLNIPSSLAYQKKTYGHYSKKVGDFTKLGILQNSGSPSYKALIQMIDPYSYRKKLTMPKMLFMGTNDPYWVIDNVKNYLPEIPGTNLINYTPNAGHFLNHNVLAYPALSAFFGIILNHGNYPKCVWSTSVQGNAVKLNVKASADQLLGAKIWYADSKDKDFRDENWHSRNLNVSHQSEVTAKEPLPSTGFHAFYMALTYKNPEGGKYVICTRAFMTDTQQIL
jgi:PhoPQ-activated pathogenicity-related protein